MFVRLLLKLKDEKGQLDLSSLLEKKEEDKKEETDDDTGEDGAGSQDGDVSVDGSDEKQTDSEQGEEDNSDLIELDNGEKISLEELKRGYLREKDYTKNMQEISELRRNLEKEKERLSNQNATPTQQQQAIDNAIDENRQIEEALKQLDDDDPTAIILKTLLNQNKKLINYVETQIQEQKTLSQEEQEQQLREQFLKVTKESIDNEAKNYNLPKIKTAEGEEIDFREWWENGIKQALMSVNEELTLTEYKALIKEAGKEAYGQIRKLLSAMASQKAREKESKVGETAEIKNRQSQQENKVNPLDLRSVLSKALDKRLEQRRE